MNNMRPKEKLKLQVTVTCLLPMKLNSGGAIPNLAETHASSATLLGSMAPGGLADATDGGGVIPGTSEWGTFIFAAGGRETRRKLSKKNIVPG